MGLRSESSANRSQMTSKWNRNKGVAHKDRLSVSLMIFPHFDVSCDQLLNRPTATWDLFVLTSNKAKMLLMVASSVCSPIDHK